MLWAGACATTGHPNIPSRIAETSSHQFAVVARADTLGWEVVTRCGTKVIADNDWNSPRAHLHYEVTLSADGRPVGMTLLTWSSSPLDGPPDQRVEHRVALDTLYTIVMTGTMQQLQKTALPADSYLYSASYVGLLTIILESLENRRATEREMSLVYLATGGHLGRARLIAGDTSAQLLEIDGVRAELEYDAHDGLRRLDVNNGAYRIVRTNLDSSSEALAASRCRAAAGGTSATIRSAPPVLVPQLKGYVSLIE